VLLLDEVGELPPGGPAILLRRISRIWKSTPDRSRMRSTLFCGLCRRRSSSSLLPLARQRIEDLLDLVVAQVSAPRHLGSRLLESGAR
jgi:hypothetical protein